jgi:Lhr-like helicase
LGESGALAQLPQPVRAGLRATLQPSEEVARILLGTCVSSLICWRRGECEL